MRFLTEKELPDQLNIFDIDKEKKASELYDQIKDKNNIEDWFAVLVPGNGKADTKAGELIRAMMRILYRNYNDGDRFFSGYGVETCGGSAQYIMENTDEELADLVRDIADRQYITDDDYTDAINNVAAGLLNYLQKHQELLAEENDDDSREWELDEIYIPKYDIDIRIPERIQDYIANGKYSEDELEGEVYYWEVAGLGAIGYVADRIYVDGDVLWFEGVPEAVYNELEHDGYRWLKDLEVTLADELGEIEDEEYNESVVSTLDPKKVAAYNKGLELAKKEDKPVIYGYSLMKTGEFTEVEPFIYDEESDEFKDKYKEWPEYEPNIIYVAYPDHDFIKKDWNIDII